MTTKPVVFLSYAHENDDHRNAVNELATWLSSNGCEMLTDHAYWDRPPEEGWPSWMETNVLRANVVLIVCTPKLKARYEKTAVADSGLGATFEGHIITQMIYGSGMRNKKSFPILPDEGSIDDIPVKLQAWWSDHRFPSGRERILRLVIATAKSADSSAQGDSDSAQTSRPQFNSDQERLATERLSEAGRFLAALQQIIDSEFAVSAPDTAHAMARWFQEYEPPDLLDLFYAIRRALEVLAKIEMPAIETRLTEEAAAAVYFLSACRFVNKAYLGDSIDSDTGSRLVHVPRDEGVVCAIIATALFGGKLKVAVAGSGEDPEPQYVFRVDVEGRTDLLDADFERQVYVAMFQNDLSAPRAYLLDGPLSEDQRKRIIVRIRSIRRKDKSSLAFVLPEKAYESVASRFSHTHKVPVMIPATEFTTELLGIDAGELLAEIREFWSELTALAEPSGTAPSGI